MIKISKLLLVLFLLFLLFPLNLIASGTGSGGTGGSSIPGGVAGGDLSGTYPNPTVAKINGASLDTVTATSGNVLIGSGTAWVTKPISGDAALTSAGALTLANTAVTAGSYGGGSKTLTITSDSKGRITALAEANIAIAESQVTNLVSDLALKAPLASPVLTGIPTAPTASQSNNSTQLATTAYVDTGLGTKVTAALTSGNIFVGNVSNVASSITPSGDLAINNSGVFTLNTVNSNTGSFGSSTSIPTLTINGKGLITAASGNVVVAPAGTLTGTTLAANVVSSSLTSVGIITSGTWSGSFSDATLTALAAYNTNGILTQTSADTFTGRAITGTSNQIIVNNGSGVSGNPTLSLPQDFAKTSNPILAGTYWSNDGALTGTYASVLSTPINTVNTIDYYSYFITSEITNLLVDNYLTLNGLTANKALVLDSNKVATASATTDTQIGYLSSTTGVTGSGKLVLDISPTITTPTFSGTASGSISGNAATATALQTARTINGVSFNGTANINIPNGGATVTAKTGDYTISTSDSGVKFTNTGAAGAINLTLPASPTSGERQPFCVTNNQYLRVSANTGQTINLGGSVSASAGYVRANTKGNCLVLEYDNTNEWYAESITGSAAWLIDQ